MLKLTGATTRPDIVLCKCDHPLYQEQRFGISIHRAHEYSSYF